MVNETNSLSKGGLDFFSGILGQHAPNVTLATSSNIYILDERNRKPIGERSGAKGSTFRFKRTGSLVELCVCAQQ